MIVRRPAQPISMARMARQPVIAPASTQRRAKIAVDQARGCDRTPEVVGRELELVMRSRRQR